MASRDQLVEAWVFGWAHSRGTPAPQAKPYGFELQVGLPGHIRRHVLPTMDESQIQILADRIEEPGIFLKVCAPAEHVAKVLPPSWSTTVTNTLMSTPLHAAQPPTLPDGFSISDVLVSGSVLSVVIHAGEVQVANGRVGLHEHYAVFDQIETSPDFQRRGLGRTVMAALTSAARALGATVGVLVASDEGRALYSTLGWRVETPLTTAVRSE